MSMAAAARAATRAPGRAAARFVQTRLRSSGKVLSEEEKAAENVYIKGWTSDSDDSDKFELDNDGEAQPSSAPATRNFDAPGPSILALDGDDAVGNNHTTSGCILPVIEDDDDLDFENWDGDDDAGGRESSSDDSCYEMGDCSVEVTGESLDSSQEAIGQAMEALSEGKLEEAFEHLTKALLLNPRTSAIMYGRRAAPGLKPSKRVGTGFPGVRWEASGKFSSHFKDKKEKDAYVGTFHTLEEAVKARVMEMLKVKRPKAKKLKGSKAKKLKGSKAKKQLEREQEDKLKDDSLRKLEEKCQHLQDKIKELEIEQLLQRLNLELQEMKFPLTMEEAGSEHGQGWSPIEGRASAGKTKV